MFIWPCYISQKPVFYSDIRVLSFQNFFMIGTNNDQSLYKILTIDRLKPSELDIREDPNTYNEVEYNELIEKIKEESDPNGGFNFVTDFYGIIGRSIFDLSY